MQFFIEFWLFLPFLTPSPIKTQFKTASKIFNQCKKKLYNFHFEMQKKHPLVTHLINWIIDLFNRDRTD